MCIYHLKAVRESEAHSFMTSILPFNGIVRIYVELLLLRNLISALFIIHAERVLEVFKLPLLDVDVGGTRRGTCCHESTRM